MEFTAQIIADYLSGSIEGDKNSVVTGLSKIEDGQPGTLSFLANPKYSRYLYTTQSTIVLINNDFVLEKPVNCTLIRVVDAYKSIASLLEFYNKNHPNLVGIDPLAFIHPTAQVGKGVYIAPFVYVGENAIVADEVKLYPHVYLSSGVKVGKRTTLASGVKIYNDCVIGESCLFHSGVVIGCDGFGFAQQTQASYKKVPQVGNVIVENNVEIGANTTIDRATMGSTIIRSGVKLDNLIQIAHNVEIGENTVIAAQTGISGSTKIGKNCVIGGQVGFVGHIDVADGVKIGAKSGISTSLIIENEVVLGAPAMPIRDARKSFVIIRNLPKMSEKIDSLEKEIETLKAIIAEKLK